MDKTNEKDHLKDADSNRISTKEITDNDVERMRDLFGDMNEDLQSEKYSNFAKLKTLWHLGSKTKNKNKSKNKNNDNNNYNKLTGEYKKNGKTRGRNNRFKFGDRHEYQELIQLDDNQNTEFDNSLIESTTNTVAVESHDDHEDIDVSCDNKDLLDKVTEYIKEAKAGKGPNEPKSKDTKEMEKFKKELKRDIRLGKLKEDSDQGITDLSKIQKIKQPVHVSKNKFFALARLELKNKSNGNNKTQITDTDKQLYVNSTSNVIKEEQVDVWDSESSDTSIDPAIIPTPNSKTQQRKKAESDKSKARNKTTKDKKKSLQRKKMPKKSGKKNKIKLSETAAAVATRSQYYHDKAKLLKAAKDKATIENNKSDEAETSNDNYGKELNKSLDGARAKLRVSRPQKISCDSGSAKLEIEDRNGIDMRSFKRDGEYADIYKSFLGKFTKPIKDADIFDRWHDLIMKDFSYTEKINAKESLTHRIAVDRALYGFRDLYATADPNHKVGILAGMVTIFHKYTFLGPVATIISHHLLKLLRKWILDHCLIQHKYTFVEFDNTGSYQDRRAASHAVQEAKWDDPIKGIWKRESTIVINREVTLTRDFKGHKLIDIFFMNRVTEQLPVSLEYLSHTNIPALRSHVNNTKDLMNRIEINIVSQHKINYDRLDMFKSEPVFLNTSELAYAYVCSELQLNLRPDFE